MIDLTKQIVGTKDDSELLDILKAATDFCKKYGCESVEICIDDKDLFFKTDAVIHKPEGKIKWINGYIPKPIKVTMQDIEKRFGFPVEIVP